MAKADGFEPKDVQRKLRKWTTGICPTTCRGIT